MFVDDEVDHRSVMSSQQEPLVSAPEPFDAFYSREVRRLVGLAYALSGSRLVADDLAQEAMLAAYKNWGDVDDWRIRQRGCAASYPTRQFPR